jgi:hypothetical protein
MVSGDFGHLMLSGNLDHLTVFGNLSSFNGFVGQAALLSDPSNVLGLCRYGLFLECFSQKLHHLETFSVLSENTTSKRRPSFQRHE